MTPQDRARRVREVFDAIVGAPADRREEVLRERCSGDAGLRAEVESLLLHDAATGGIDLTRPLVAAAGEIGAQVESDPARLVGAAIGPYVLVGVLGSGGFGVVYEAERREPYVQRVALKIIKPGMDSGAVIARFEQERQALAVMDHPNVARVIDGGVTSAELGSRPYFVMELVRGEPITAYCDRHRLTIRQRLELFIPVCEAVQHAHMKGIIHRDLKPSNILVGEEDRAIDPGSAGSMRDGGSGGVGKAEGAGEEHRPLRAGVDGTVSRVRVIDFGVAKAISQRDAEKATFTLQGTFIGTPEYMSPEQAAGAVDIDTRTDVYSLGVVLYELLTGALPFDPIALRSAAIDEIRRIIREQEPPTPSGRVSGIGEAEGSRIAVLRGVERGGAASLARELKRELEWVPLKAMRKERGRRYGSPKDLAADVQRYLSAEPLEAAPESASYRVAKFARRNRVGAIACAAVVAALAIGVGVALSQRAAAAKAKRDSDDELKQVSDFQANMLAQLDPTKAGKLLSQDIIAKFEAALTKSGMTDAERAAQVEAFAGQWRRINATDAARELIDRTILKPAVDAIERQFKDQPIVEAQLRQALADRYKELGLYDAALSLQEQALATRRRVLGEEHLDTVGSLNNLGVLLELRGKWEKAEGCFRAALDVTRRVLGNDHPKTLTALHNVGYVLQAQRKLGEAEPILRESMDTLRRVIGQEDADTLISINNFGMLMQDQGRLDEAERYFREAVDKSRQFLGEENTHTLAAMNNLGSLLLTRKRPGEAEPYLRKALENRRRILGEEHSDTLVSMINMGQLLCLAQRKLDEAEPYLKEAMDKSRQKSGENNPRTLSAISNFATLLVDQGRLSEAEPYSREVLERRREVLGEDHPRTLAPMSTLGLLLQKEGKLSDAELYLREVLERRRRISGENDRDTLSSANNLGCLLQEQGKLTEAEPNIREAVEGFRRLLGPDHADTLALTMNLGSLFLAQGKYEEVKNLIAPPEPAARSAFTGEIARQLGTWLKILGKARVGLGEFSVAEVNLLEAHAIFTTADNATRRNTRECVDALVVLYAAWHTAEPGRGYDAKAAEWHATLDTSAADPAERPSGKKK